jgi:transposase-like protein
MNFNFKTIHEFNDYFKDEKTCYEFLESQLWSGVPVCPHCATAKKPYTVKARGKFQDIPSYRCSERACGLPFTVRTGGIFEGSKIELRKWLLAVYEITIGKKGISSYELAGRIGVSQKTAWFINHRLRAMLTETQPELLAGTIEVDETFVGGKEINKHLSKKVKRSPISRTLDEKIVTPKTMVLGVLSREDNKVRTFVVPDRKAETLNPIMRENVETNSRIISDAWAPYTNLQHDYDHVAIKHSKGDFRTHGDKHTNNIEGYWSILKRGIVGTFHSVSPQHLQRYCDEFAHRYNNRLQPVDTKFAESIKQFAGVRLKYRELTPNQPEPHRKARYNKKATE